MPTDPGDSGEVFPIVSAAFTGSVKLALVCWDCEPVAVTPKLTGPAIGGTPIKRPLEERLNQLGSPEPDQL